TTGQVTQANVIGTTEILVCDPSPGAENPAFCPKGETAETAEFTEDEAESAPEETVESGWVEVNIEEAETAEVTVENAIETEVAETAEATTEINVNDEDLAAVYVVGSTGGWQCVFVIAPEDIEQFERTDLENRLKSACDKGDFIQDALGRKLKDEYAISFCQSPSEGKYYLGGNKVCFTPLSLGAAQIQRRFATVLSFSALDGVSLPAWFEVGVAERVSDLAFDTDTTRMESYAEGEWTDMRERFGTKFDTQNYANARYVNYVVKQFVDKYGMDALRKTLSILDKKGGTGTAQQMDEALLDAMRQATGDSSITLEDFR
ncbi:hypothetical protein KJ891_02655, partial [Candidatus Micrarchaeota archaeon]|nr:hypothetical protein [Candidatus Micrarchaeota archaeon]